MEPEQAALQLLCEANVQILPVEPAELAAFLHIPMVNYTQLESLSFQGRSLLEARSADGLSLLLNGHPVILYNHCMPKPRLKWTIAHELGHIRLGHLSPSGPKKVPPVGPVSFEEIQANLFARALLCPMEILHFCGCEQASELAALTGLSSKAALRCFEQLQLRRKANAFLRSEEANALVQQFLPYISRIQSQKLKDAG